MTYLCETCIHREPCMYEEIGVTSCTYYLQERPKGRWVHLGGDEWCCSNCGHVIFTEGSWEKPTTKFCEECGADMRESE